MITQKKITIPIFNYKLTIVIFDKWKECDKFLPADEMEIEANAITIHNYGASLVAVNAKRESSIAHESEHIKNLFPPFLFAYYINIILVYSK